MDNRKRPGSLSEIVRSDGSNKNQPQKAPGHYVVVGEMPVESFSATPSAVSVGHDAAPGSEGRRKAGISTWMWRLAVALLLVAILGRLVWEYLPGLSEWLSHETKNLP
jgi:hypothetical protein